MDAVTQVGLLAAVALVSGLGAGCIPLWRKVSEQENLLKWMTGLAAGVLLASALLVALPEGFEIASEAGSGGLFLGGAVLAGFLMTLLADGGENNFAIIFPYSAVLTGLAIVAALFVPSIGGRRGQSAVAA